MESHAHTNGVEPLTEERHLPVLASEPTVIERRYESPLPAPAIAATGGFLAGVATLLLVRVLRRSASGRRGRRGVALRRSRRGDRSIEIAGSKSFLVDVHMLKR
jgi:hypothetical protein